MRHLALLSLLVAGCYNPDIPAVGFFCHPDDKPACPDGSQCTQYDNPNTHRMEYRCIKAMATAPVDMAGGFIPKSSFYTGNHVPPSPPLDTAAECPDAPLEPNDSAQSALDVNASILPTPDQPTSRFTNMAICPTGPRPETGMHDVDYFKVDTTKLGTNSPLWLRGDLFYDVTMGDLDIGIFDQNGSLLASDGSAVSNGCATTQVPPGTYFVVIVGANNMDVNHYELRISTHTGAQMCPNAGPTDGG